MKKMSIFTCPGLGDALWTITKIPDMRRKLNPDKVNIVVQNTDFNRSDDFLLHFNFIDSVSYDDFDIHPEPIYFEPIYGNVPKPTDDYGRYIYCDSTGNFMGDPNSWLLIANGHLERGHRLETWYPEFETEIDIAKHYRMREDEIEWAETFHLEQLNNRPFIVFYMGPLNGNTTLGHNRNGLWSLRNWYEVGNSLPSEYKIVIVGHQHDWQYANLFMGSLSEFDRHWYINLCGQTEIGQCYALIKRSKFLLSFQSGVGIFSAYMGHPTAIWWRPKGDSISTEYYLSFEEDMSHCWVPMEYINKTYFPLIYSKQNPTQISQIINQFL